MMPSRFEPCGLNQLYSMKYGTIPLVHATGGLDDSVTPIPADGSIGNGFKFQEYTVTDLMLTLKQAIALYKKESTWRQIQRRAMSEDYSWSKSAKEYIDLYQSLLA